jgi:hypothetical protein
MPMARKTKVLLILSLFGLIALYAGYQALKFWWYTGYSKGSRTGIIRKLSLKGPPYCKYISAEMALQGTGPGQPPEIWEFSLDKEDQSSPLYKQLEEAQRAAKPVTLRYRQDLKMWWRCAPTEYFVTEVEK